ncbi:unnamed protein product [Bursaphelenchus xylophilus]|uniref:(pine wood nematode) hypothetical protein n=1 Tax=Bursaphelenchus xylophilus TaxID=6326 RepID=A0A7I8XCW3_BURXY|nr:unnamed protein product [Bursaphelenchus xylophilus]CAG9114139.1 unnamed protein product [Bursaphelenchus xylophilus]
MGNIDIIEPRWFTQWTIWLGVVCLAGFNVITWSLTGFTQFILNVPVIHVGHLAQPTTVVSQVDTTSVNPTPQDQSRSSNSHVDDVNQNHIYDNQINKTIQRPDVAGKWASHSEHEERNSQKSPLRETRPSNVSNELKISNSDPNVGKMIKKKRKFGIQKANQNMHQNSVEMGKTQKD